MEEVIYCITLQHWFEIKRNHFAKFRGRTNVILQIFPNEPIIAGFRLLKFELCF